MVTTFSKKDTAYIMAPILLEGLHKVRTQSRLPRALVHGPTKYQGYGIYDPWALQLVEHICYRAHTGVVAASLDADVTEQVWVHKEYPSRSRRMASSAESTAQRSPNEFGLPFHQF